MTSESGQQVYDVVEGSVRAFRILNPHSALLVEAPGETIMPWHCAGLGPKDAEPDLDELERLLESL